MTDRITNRTRERVVRNPAYVYGVSGRRNWARPANRSDVELLERIAEEPVPACVPQVTIPWGDLYRSGYHRGITHVHHFYTDRNLLAVAKLWELTERHDSRLRDALRFWILSYNASHATMMSRVVAKSGQRDLVVTGAQPGVLYFSGLPVEKNVFSGLRRKLKTITAAFDVIHGRTAKVEVVQGSSCELDLPDGSVDYVFTDPPFGGNIPYAEVNFLNEAWLGQYTNREQEIVVSESQSKTVADYQQLLLTAFSELRRVLKPRGKVTVVFHSSSPAVWNALQDAYTGAGFGVECTGLLDKVQASFKQVTAAGAVRGDPVLLLSDVGMAKGKLSDGVWQIAERLCADSQHLDSAEQTPQRIYSRLIAHFVAASERVPVGAREFYRWYESRLDARSG